MSEVFQGKLAEHLDFGHVLEIAAKAESKATWFSISLAEGQFNEGDSLDIGLRMSVYLNEDLIVFKQQIHGEWLPSISEDFPTEIFHQPFKVILAMDEKKFHISVNGEHRMLVKYAVAVTKLNTVKIAGDLSSVAQVDHRKYYPTPWPPIQMSEDRLHFSHDVPVSFRPGHVMVITMKLLGKMKGRFHLHFRNAWNCKRQEAHISVRFDSKKIVRTSRLPALDHNGNPDKMEFGPEETEGIFPFDLFPMAFKLAIGFTATSLRMAKDGAFLFDYAFRTPNVLADLSGVKIMGINGMTVRVSGIDHMRLPDPFCEGFEQHSDS